MMKLHVSAAVPARTGRAPLTAGFQPPTHDLADLLGTLGTKLFTRERTLVQYVTWAVNSGLLEVIDERMALTVQEASASTPLTERGVDALLSVLSAIALVRRSVDGRYSLTAASRDYLLRRSPFFIGDQLEPFGFPIHGLYLKRRAGLLTRVKLRLLGQLPVLRYGTRQRIDNQHARNLAACVAAVRTGAFAHAECIVDLAGGSGVFAIPLLLEYPHKRVILVELPEALANIRPILTEHHVADRVELRAMDLLRFPWHIPPCDGFFVGNFLHGFSDEVGLRICREVFARLPAGGRIWLHEMVWNDTRDGPLITALWHAAMLSAGAAGQRTAAEWVALLERAGFEEIQVVPTASAFALVSGRRP